MKKITTTKIDSELLRKICASKVHPRESNNDAIDRIYRQHEQLRMAVQGKKK